MDTEIIGYGRLPMLTSQSCLIKPRNNMCACGSHIEMLGQGGEHLPLVKDSGHGTVVYQSNKLWLLNVKKHWEQIGLWALRLDFTTENPRECAKITQAYINRAPFKPNSQSLGFYMPEEPMVKRMRFLPLRNMK